MRIGIWFTLGLLLSAAAFLAQVWQADLTCANYDYLIVEK